jgi:hypothetical protein
MTKGQLMVDCTWSIRADRAPFEAYLISSAIEISAQADRRLMPSL